MKDLEDLRMPLEVLKENTICVKSISTPIGRGDLEILQFSLEASVAARFFKPQ